MAAKFVDFVHRETKFAIIVCDAGGIIREAVVKSRIGTPHAGAQRILRGEVDDVFVTAEEAAANPLVKEGYNAPIVIDGKRIGTFGLAGPLEVTRPIARVAAAVLATWLEDAEHRSRLEGAAASMLQTLRALSARVEGASAATRETAERSAAATKLAEDKAALAGEVIRTVQEVAQQSRILAINGSVEATRAGELGKAFAVVAREMVTLSEDARVSSQKIAGALGEIRRALEQIEGALAASASSSKEQLAILREVLTKAEGLQGTVTEVLAAMSKGA